MMASYGSTPQVKQQLQFLDGWVYRSHSVMRTSTSCNRVFKTILAGPGATNKETRQVADNISDPLLSEI